MLFPFKLAGLYLIGHGHPALGLAVFVLAKALGAAALARVWTLTEKSLRQIGWLSRSVDWIVAKKDALKCWVSGLWAIRMAKGFTARLGRRARTARTRLASKAWARALLRAKRDF